MWAILKYTDGEQFPSMVEEPFDDLILTRALFYNHVLNYTDRTLLEGQETVIVTHPSTGESIVIKLEKFSYPFEEGEDYWTIEDGKPVLSCWDSESESLFRLDKEYFGTEEECQERINLTNEREV